MAAAAVLVVVARVPSYCCCVLRPSYAPHQENVAPHQDKIDDVKSPNGDVTLSMTSVIVSILVKNQRVVKCLMCKPIMPSPAACHLPPRALRPLILKFPQRSPSILLGTPVSFSCSLSDERTYRKDGLSKGQCR
jgi:hypothetical protein